MTLEVQVKVETLIDAVVGTRLSLEKDLTNEFREQNGEVNQEILDRAR